jgi:uncharacterized spore protein YtfJ
MTSSVSAFGQRASSREVKYTQNVKEDKVEELEGLVKSTVDEIQKVIGASCIVGEPKVVGETTIVPLISTGFWFIGGSGHDRLTEKKVKEGSKYGTGGGGGVRPVALVIIDKEGARVESIRGLVSGTIEKIAEKAPDLIAAFRGQQKQG